MKLFQAVVLGCVLLFIPAFTIAGIISPQLHAQIEKSNSEGTYKVILTMADQADIYALDYQLISEKSTLARRNYQVITTLQEKATQTQPPVLAMIDDLSAKGEIKNVKTLWLANFIFFDGTAKAITALAMMDDVGTINVDYPVELIEPIENPKPAEPDILAKGIEQGLIAIHAPETWALGYTGLGRVVSNLDTGVDGTHPALADRFRGDVDEDGDVDESWYDPYDTNWDFPQDSGTHGTHTMGTICGRSAAGDTIGVAIDALWIATAPVDRDTIERTISDILLSFQWIADPDGDPLTQDNPDACGNSWGIPDGIGYPDCDTTFWVAIDNCEAAGTVVIFSAGNEGSNGLRSPADRATTYYNCFSVGSIDANDPSYPISYFSALGPTECATGDLAIKPEVVAPGSNVRSSIPGGGYGTKSGTSMASPHVTGAVAVIRQANPNLDANTIKEILMATAIDLPLASPDGEENTFGHGLINLYQAVLFAQGFGFVDGYITDAGTSAPIPGKVSVVDMLVQTNANASGYYFFGLLADTTFILEASYFGYLSQQQSVYVILDDTVSQDFSLTLAPTAVLEGTVTSVAGDSIPNAEISILNTPVGPETTDANGYYQFPSLPSGSTYDVQVKAIGYSQGLDSILIQDGQTNVLDFSLWPAESFEANNGGYSGNGVWEWGEPTYGPSGAWSGTKVWGTVLGEEYPNNVDDNLISSAHFISDPDARFEFYHWYDIENSWDGGNVSISTNGGADWELLTPYGSYPDPNIVAFGSLEPGYTNLSDGWVHAAFDISSYYNQNVMFRWRFGTDGSVTRAGWYIDDVVVVGSQPPTPPDMSYNPSSYDIYLQPGNNQNSNLTLTNDGDGSLNYNLSTEIYTLLTLDNGQTLPVTISPQKAEPIGYRPASDKKGAKAEPYYPPLIANYGGPDDYGYSWIDSDEPDGPAYSWVDITSIGTQITDIFDDTNVGPFSFGFNFNFYGNNFDSFRFSTNGFISFTSTYTSYSNYSIPSNSEPYNIIAPFWDDLDFRYGGSAYYYTNNSDSLVISWIDVPHYSSGGPYSFQVILLSSGKIIYQYQVINSPDNSTTVGIQDESSIIGLEVVYNAAYVHNNLAVEIDSDPIWLSIYPEMGTVPPHEFYNATVTFDATELDVGVYTGNINLLTNDPVEPDVDIPVTLTVGGDPGPMIDLSLFEINDTLYIGQSTDIELFVINVGTADLDYNLSDNSDWISVSPDSGTVPPSMTDTLTITLNAAALDEGSYNDTITVSSNDPAQPEIDIPVNLVVEIETIPVIDISIDSIEKYVYEDSAITIEITIGNNGNGTLTYGITDNRAWLSENPDNGTVAEGESPDTITITLDASGLTEGDYIGAITVTSNDPVDSIVEIGVTLHVIIFSSCDYLPGDINGDDIVIASDVVYGVNYFRGTGNQPPDSCQLPDESWLYVASDVNASCSFLGSDITYLIRYFRGQSDTLRWCPDVPPSTMPASISLPKPDKLDIMIIPSDSNKKAVIPPKQEK